MLFPQPLRPTNRAAHHDQQIEIVQLGNDPWVTSLEQARDIYLKEYRNWGDYVKVAKIEPQG